MDNQTVQTKLLNLFNELGMTKDAFNTYFFDKALEYNLEVGKRYIRGEAFLKYINDGKGQSKSVPQLVNYAILSDRLLEELQSQRENAMGGGNYTLSKTTYHTLFYQTLKRELKKIFDSQKYKDLKPFLANRCKVHPEDIEKLVVAFPVTIFCIANKKLFTHDDYVSDLLTITDQEKYNPKTLKAPDYNVNRKFAEHKGLLLGHSISPYSEQLNVLLELGRYKRIQTVFKLPAKIIVTNPEWGELNYASQKLKKENFDIKINLESAFRYRQKLYEKIGFSKDNVEVLSKTQTVSKYLVKSKENGVSDEEYGKYITDNRSNFESELDWYSVFANTIKEYFNIGEFNRENVNQFIGKIDEILSETSKEFRNSLRRDLFLLRNNNEINNKQLKVIRSIAKSFHTIDKGTFEYVFLQRNAQHNYSDFLKIGVESEYKFDKPYYELDKLDGILNHNLSVFYLQQYWYGSTNEKYTIPYYFPSGNIDTKFPIIEDAEKEVIFVFDHKSDDRKYKVKNIIGEMTLYSIAVQMSDLFSFIFYFFKDDSTFFNDFLKIIFGFDTEMYDSWNEHIQDEDVATSNFLSNLFSVIYDFAQLPYYYFPYLIALKIRANNDTELENKFRNLFYDSIMFTLENVDQEMNIEEWKYKTTTSK